MNVGELLEALEGLDPEIEIRVGYQPNYPLRGFLAGVVTPTGLADTIDPDLDDVNFEESDQDPYEEASQAITEGFAWIVVGDGLPYSENPYASKALWGAL